MKKTILIVTILCLSFLAKAIDSSQLFEGLTELEERGSKFMKEQTLSLADVLSSSLISN